jgi:hypothetical protein
MHNPIIDNRIVEGVTFATRLKNFLENVHVNDYPSEEEKNYLVWVADELQKYQIETATEEYEVKYLKQLGLK